MNDKKERVYSEEDLCEYTILQKIDELEKQLKNIKNEFNGLYETKEAADATHRLLRSNDAKLNNRIDTLNNITPTDVGVKDNKLGLLHNTTWLANQGAINIGDGLSYDATTKTLKAGGGGGAGSAMHCYYVEVDGQFIYIVNTEKNYNFMIGKKMTVSDFISNPEYKELHAGGSESFGGYRCYPASGTYKGSDGALRVVKNFYIYDDATSVVQGISLDSSITSIGTSINLYNIDTFSIVQLY